MLFPGTDRAAYKKASRGKTPKQRSRIYYKEKAKNERKLNQSKKTNLTQPIDLSVKSSSYPKNINHASRMRLKQPLRVTPTVRERKSQTLSKIEIKQLLKKSNSIIWDKALDNLSDTIKDKILDFTLELIKENSNEQIEKIIDTYQTIEKYTKVAQRFYRVIVEIDKKINKFCIKYEQQPNNENSQLKYNNEYERHKTIYLKYENISNLASIDLKNLEVWHLGKHKKQANKLFKLVLSGKKIATSYLYDKNESRINNSYSILTNWDKKKQVLIQTTNIQIVPFSKVTKQHARNEGEGTKTLSYWRKIHKKIFVEELDENEKSFSKETLIVCETFRVVKILK